MKKNVHALKGWDTFPQYSGPWLQVHISFINGSGVTRGGFHPLPLSTCLASAASSRSSGWDPCWWNWITALTTGLRPGNRVGMASSAEVFIGGSWRSRNRAVAASTQKQSFVFILLFMKCRILLLSFFLESSPLGDFSLTLKFSCSTTHWNIIPVLSRVGGKWMAWRIQFRMACEWSFGVGGRRRYRPALNFISQRCSGGCLLIYGWDILYFYKWVLQQFLNVRSDCWIPVKAQSKEIFKWIRNAFWNCRWIVCVYYFQVCNIVFNNFYHVPWWLACKKVNQRATNAPNISTLSRTHLHP